MISQVFETENIKLSNDYYGKKIQSLINAYGVNYPFCRLYKCDGGYFAEYNSSMVIDVANADISELCGYIDMSKPQSIEVSSHITLQLNETYAKKHRTLFRGASHENNVNAQNIMVNTSLSDIFPILRDSFGLTEYEEWYADISHKIRHGVSRIFLYENTTMTEQFDIDGFVFVSHIATAKTERGKGTARNLLYKMCSEYAQNGKHMHLFALDERKTFYACIGFEPVYEDYIYEYILR